MDLISTFPVNTWNIIKSAFREGFESKLYFSDENRSYVKGFLKLHDYNLDNIKDFYFKNKDCFITKFHYISKVKGPGGIQPLTLTHATIQCPDKTFKSVLLCDCPDGYFGCIMFEDPAVAVSKYLEMKKLVAALEER
jgi:hypothetical protein